MNKMYIRNELFLCSREEERVKIIVERDKMFIFTKDFAKKLAAHLLKACDNRRQLESLIKCILDKYLLVREDDDSLKIRYSPYGKEDEDDSLTTVSDISLLIKPHYLNERFKSISDDNEWSLPTISNLTDSSCNGTVVGKITNSADISNYLDDDGIELDNLSDWSVSDLSRLHETSTSSMESSFYSDDEKHKFKFPKVYEWVKKACKTAQLDPTSPEELPDYFEDVRICFDDIPMDHSDVHQETNNNGTDRLYHPLFHRLHSWVNEVHVKDDKHVKENLIASTALIRKNINPIEKSLNRKESSVLSKSRLWYTNNNIVNAVEDTMSSDNYNVNNIMNTNDDNNSRIVVDTKKNANEKNTVSIKRKSRGRRCLSWIKKKMCCYAA